MTKTTEIREMVTYMVQHVNGDCKWICRGIFHDIVVQGDSEQEAIDRFHLLVDRYMTLRNHVGATNLHNEIVITHCRVVQF